MTEHSVSHATFVIERTYAASPARVFAAFASREAKMRWFAGPAEWGPPEHTLDFRVGGREHISGRPRGGPRHVYEGGYQDIVPNVRIITTYDMHLDEKHISVSLATFELKPAGSGTRLVYTEQAAFLDGYDDAGSREHGTRELLDKLGKALAREAAGA